MIKKKGELTEDKLIRITLDLKPVFYKRLLELENLVGAESKARLIRDALQIYEYIAKRSLEGDTFQAISKDGKTEKFVIIGPPLP